MKRESKDNAVIEESKDVLDYKVFLVHLVQRENQAMPVVLVFLDKRVVKVNLGHRDQKGLLAYLVLQANLEKLDPKENLVSVVSPAHLVVPVPEAQKVTLVHVVKTAQLVHKDRLVQWVHLVKMVLRVILDLLVCPAIQVHLVNPAVLA